MIKLIDLLVESRILLETKLNILLPQNVKDIFKAFKKEHKKLYIVGGAVRDAVLGKKPKDFDLATDIKPDDVLNIARKYGFNYSDVGKKFGVVIVNGEEIATFRKDIGSGRRPDSVDFTDMEGDVKRRDLTINSLFYDIDKKEVIDLEGGLDDLRNKVIRTVGNASDRFREDSIRKLRALRFKSAMGAKLDDKIYDSIKKDNSLEGVSYERIQDEFLKSIKSAKSTKEYLKTLEDLNYFDLILPNLEINTDYINTNDYIVNLAYLLKDNDIEYLSNTLRKLKYTVDDIKSISFLISLNNFSDDDIVSYKKSKKSIKLTDNQILKYGKLINKPMDKFVNFELSIRSSDAPNHLKGKELGDWIKQKEISKFKEL